MTREPDYRIQIGPDGQRLGLWAFEETSADRIDVASASTRWDARDGLSVLETMQKYSPAWFEGEGGFFELNLLPGQYYPRMARSHDAHPHDQGMNPGAELEASFIAIARSQLSFLTAQLARICQTVHPSEATLTVYGHEIDPPSFQWTPMLAFRSWRGVSDECCEAPDISGIVQARGG
jgi:hypothetical protein